MRPRQIRQDVQKLLKDFKAKARLEQDISVQREGYVLLSFHNDGKPTVAAQVFRECEHNTKATLLRILRELTGDTSEKETRGSGYVLYTFVPKK